MIYNIYIYIRIYIYTVYTYCKQCFSFCTSWSDSLYYDADHIFWWLRIPNRNAHMASGVSCFSAAGMLSLHHEIIMSKQRHGLRPINSWANKDIIMWYHDLLCNYIYIYCINRVLTSQQSDFTNKNLECLTQDCYVNTRNIDTWCVKPAKI